MENPYRSASTEPFNNPKNEKFRIIDFIILFILVLFSSYGCSRFLEDVGVVVTKNDRAEFWFEDDLRRWIHKQK